ncbi:MAG: hypothetical protein EHM41_19570, partial [Chloroflexi bacterium]
MKKLFLMIALLVIASMLLAACQKATPVPTEELAAEAQLPEEMLIGVSQRWGTAAFLKTIDLGARDAAKEWEEKLGVKIELRTTDAGA